MKKISVVKLVPLVLVFMMLFAACTTTQPPADPTSPAPPAVTPDQEPGNIEVNEIPEVQLSAEEKAKLDALTPIYDSLMRAMRELPPERDYYDTQNEAFFWSTLYYLCVNYGEADSRITVTGDSMTVPKYVMEEYASACFGDFSELLQLPTENYGITFDEGKQQYTMGLSDKGEDYVEPIKYNFGVTSEYEVTVAWLAPGETYPDMLGVYVFVISPNQYVTEKVIPDARYASSVMYAFKDYTDVVLVKDTIEKDGKYYAVLDPAVILHHSEMDLDETTGKPYGYSWKEAYNEKEESIEYLISEYAEFEFLDLNLLFEDVDMEQILEDNMKFFVENAKREFEGEHLVFRVNLYNGVLYGGAFETENYVVG